MLRTILVPLDDSAAVAGDLVVMASHGSGGRPG
jgi:hypothetical protein